MEPRTVTVRFMELVAYLAGKLQNMWFWSWCMTISSYILGKPHHDGVALIEIVAETKFVASYLYHLEVL